MKFEKEPCLAPEASGICGDNRISLELEMLIRPRITSGHWNVKIFIDLSMLQVDTRNHILSLKRISHISHIFTFIVIPKV